MMRRYSLRKAFESKACIAAEGLLGNGRVVDLSVPGCLVETGLHLKVRQSLQLRIICPGGKPLSIPLAVVRWVNRRHAGIEFIRMSEEGQARLRWHAGFRDSRSASDSKWSEPIVWTGILGV
jgi:hypothetical protein